MTKNADFAKLADFAKHSQFANETYEKDLGIRKALPQYLKSFFEP